MREAASGEHPAGAGDESARVPVLEEADVVIARACVRTKARQNGLSEVAVAELATAISEIARNMVVHARGGEVVVVAIQEGRRTGIMVTARDAGPGIPDIQRALKDGYSTANGLGLGLSSAQRLTDECCIQSVVGTGTVVVMKKWMP